MKFILKNLIVAALVELDKALSLKPDYADALYASGKTNIKLNKRVEAKSDMQSACKMGNSSACNTHF